MTDNITLLFAEDYKVLRKLLIPILEEHSIYTIGEAENGLELLTLLEKQLPDIILLDLQMQEMNGSEAFAKIKELYPKLKIIIFSLHNDNMLINYFYLKGASAFLTKNAEIDFIVETIRKVHMGIPVPKQLKTSLENFKFSSREEEVIPLIVQGKSNKEIADKLNIGNKAVEAHKKNLFKKTKTQSAVQFVSYIFKRGLNYLR